MWLSCGFPSLGCAANRFRPPRPAGDQIQPYVRSPHKHLSPRHGHAFAPKNTIESHSFFYPKIYFFIPASAFFSNVVPSLFSSEAVLCVKTLAPTCSLPHGFPFAKTFMFYCNHCFRDPSGHLDSLELRLL